MKSLLGAVAIFVLAAEGSVLAQAPDARSSRGSVAISTGELAPTVDMWFYEQAQREYQNPKNAVRQKAEYKAAQRLLRLSAMKWYGMSNSRPTAGADYVHGDGAPRWVSGQMNHPNRWNGAGTAVVVQPRSSSPTGR